MHLKTATGSTWVDTILLAQVSPTSSISMMPFVGNCELKVILIERTRLPLILSRSTRDMVVAKEGTEVATTPSPA